MGGNYAIKSMVLIDFIDVEDNASAVPLRFHLKVFAKSRLSSNLRALSEEPGKEECAHDCSFGGKVCGKIRIRLAGSRSDMENLQRDIVGASAFAGQLYQSGTAFCRGIFTDSMFQFILRDDTPETIGAKQQIIAILQ